MTQSKAANVQNQMEKVIQRQKTHQKVKIPQNLKNYHGKIKILQDNRIFYEANHMHDLNLIEKFT